jgi:hypothetical protein
VETDETNLELEIYAAALKLETDATSLELETYTDVLHLETETYVSQEISTQERYSAD